ncbi:MAG: hypothetical protein V7K27_16705 [Nostoc sp.]|uniref:hypothetical protein n=1 Tax=Nostoc sp. TaxID=1180 RepID=UPI002FF76141
MGIGYWALGIGYWALGIGHGALGIGDSFIHLSLLGSNKVLQIINAVELMV